MGIILPELFEDKLKQNRDLRAAVDGAIADYEPWLKNSRLPFFTDYTDHGIEHLNQVLTTARQLIPEEATSIITPSDIAVLTLAVLLHDSAMHLSEAGFKSLIIGKASSWIVNELDSKPWNEAWETFLFMAKRWDESKLMNVFGNPQTIIKDPFQNYSNLAESDRRLIGEFIRINHTRMAHEFALFGIPGSFDKSIVLASRLNIDLKDIAGLVARSHGLHIRPCIEYLVTKGYNKRDYQGVHAVYLMVLLRISDYLQIQADRAHPVVFMYKHIPSKTSIQEWNTHQAITNITQTHDDPESIEVQALPQDVRTFLRLKDWISGIQDELDASWAILGEIYGRQPALRNLGLILRRIRSNLDDPKSLLSNVKYVPDRIEFNVAHSQLLKLLVKPLYGNRPQIGVRELIQHSVDAVRELWFLQEKSPELKSVSVIQQESDVEIWLNDPDEDGFAWLTISDRGIGMTENTIRDYFLTVGASFRQSEIWKKEFEIDIDEETKSQSYKSQVLRSGRFGIGVLAAFLLGDEINVETRHIESQYGLRFSTQLDAEPIELIRDVTLRVGTCIRIRVSSSVQF